MAVIGHNTQLMEEWTSNLDTKNNSYQDMIDELFNSVNTLVGSPEFMGGIPEHFQDSVLNKRANFNDYAETFADLCKFMSQKKVEIEDDTQVMVNQINNSSMFN